MKTKLMTIGTLGIALIVVSGLWVFEHSMDKEKIQPLQQFCQERGYVGFSHVDRWRYEQQALLSIYCINKQGELVIPVSIPVYRDVFNKPKEVN